MLIVDVTGFFDELWYRILPVSRAENLPLKCKFDFMSLLNSWTLKKADV